MVLAKYVRMSPGQVAARRAPSQSDPIAREPQNPGKNLRVRSRRHPRAQITVSGLPGFPRYSELGPGACRMIRSIRGSGTSQISATVTNKRSETMGAQNEATIAVM